MIDASEVTTSDAPDAQKRKRPLCTHCHEQLEYRISRGML